MPGSSEDPLGPPDDPLDVTPALPDHLLRAIEAAQLAAHKRQLEERARLKEDGDDQLTLIPLNPLSPRGTRQVFGKMLGERGLWALTPPEGDESYEIEDHRGRLEVVPSAHGVNGVPEITLLITLISLWAAGDREKSGVQASLRTLAEELGRPWSGRTSALLVTSLERLRFTGYRLVVDTEDGEKTARFTILREFSDEWQGARTDPNRRVSIEFDPRIVAMIRDPGNLRRIDTAFVQALGEQRDLAKRLTVFLETQSGGRIGDVERLNRTIDRHLAAALGFAEGVRLSRVREGIERAGVAIVDTAGSRYRTITVEPLAHPGKRGEPTHKMIVVRARRTATENT